MFLKKISLNALAVIAFALFLFACDDDSRPSSPDDEVPIDIPDDDSQDHDGEGNEPLGPMIRQLTEFPADAPCPLGGVRIDKGHDNNTDGVLSGDERESSDVICYTEDNLLAQTTHGHLWLGQNKSYVYLNNPHADKLTLVTSDNLDCNPQNLDSCENSDSYEFYNNWGGAQISAITASSPAYLWLNYKEESSNSVHTQLTELPQKGYAQVIEFNGYLWSIGGRLRQGGKTDEAIWRSSDGYHWSKVVEKAPFGQKRYHHLVVFNDKLWLTGGDLSNEVWVTDNGLDWQQVTQVTPYQGRSQHQVVVFNDKMWMLGGKGAGNAHLGDILTSTDGANWIPQTTENPFPARYWHQALVFNNKLWIFNGQSVNDRPPKRSRDIYSSVDGINWVLETNSPAYGGIIGHQILPFDGKLWLVSGYTNGYRQDVYSSDDAINWTLENNNAFEKTAYHQVVNFKRQLFMYKGSGNGYEGHLVSKNGRDWKPFNEKLFAKRQMHQVVEFNASLWMIGGRNYENEFTPGVFTSIYGQVWTQVLSGNDAPFSARDQHQLVVFNNALWVIGGRDIDGFKNDVWKSTDGKAWNKVDQVTSFSARGGHQSFVFNNKLWVVGGTSPEGYLNDVWSSGDGANWQQESSNAAFSPRYDHRVTSLNGELYLVAGFGLDDVNPVVFDDVYHSKDGIEWTHITKDADLARYGHELTTYNGQLVVTGGYVEGNASADILTSSDGIDWIKHTDALFHAGVSQHQTVFYRLQLLIIGGETNRLGFDYPDNQTYIASGFLNWYHLKPISFSFANTFEKIKLVTAAIKPQSDLLKTGYEVLLDGSESDATDYQNMAFAWTLVEKPEGSLAAIDDAFRISTHFTPDLDGTYTVELVVTDGGHSDSTRITFNTLTEPTAVITGCDANVYEGDTVTMDGSASFDKYGNPLTYFWTLSAPRGADNSLDDPTASSVTKVLNREGRYNFFLTVDNGGMAHSTSKSCQVDYFPI